MTVERTRRAQEILKQALDRPDTERAAFLDLACGGDDALRAEAGSLLAALDRAGAFLEEPALRSVATAEPPEGLLGQRLGQYRITGVIASGGMGTVYEAEQELPHRRVALKVLRRGVASREARRRFEFESHVLARLRHPGIAQVYEAGTHDDGTGEVPFFAMEHVPDARPITEYAREDELDTAARLRLFLEVCAAVQHGHGRGIIHRDLKPANVLVDAQGRVKIIDFGIARATGSDLALTEQTNVGQLLGTVQYMSPEQCTADPHDLDTRSDVYALGLILYELLSERRPYDLTDVVLPEAVRLIRDEVPPRLGGVDPSLRGDLETIVAKALEKDRERRYASADALGRDVEHFLACEPITARPPSVMYQLRVFTRRNRTLVSAVAAAIVLLVAGTLTSTVLYLDAGRKARIAENVLEFLNNDLLTAVDRHPDDEITMRMVLDSVPRNVGTRFEREPLVAATIHTTLGNAYRSLADHDAAEAHLRRAHTLRETELGPTHRDTLATRHDLAVVLQQEGEAAAAESICRAVLDARRDELGPQDRDTLASMNLLALLDHDQDRHEAAESRYRSVLVLRRRVLGDDDLDTLETIDRLATLYDELERYGEAEGLFREALDGRLEQLGTEHELTVRTRYKLAWVYRMQERFAESAEQFEECHRVHSAVRGRTHARTIEALNDMGSAYFWDGRITEMEGPYKDHIDAYQAEQDAASESLGHTLNNLAVLYKWQSRFDEARVLFEQTLELRRRVLPEGHMLTLITMHNLALLHVDLEQYEASLALATEAVETARERHADDAEHLGGFLQNRGECLMQLGRLDEAETDLLEAHTWLDGALGTDDQRTVNTVDALVRLYEARDDGASAALWRARLPATEPPGPEERRAYPPTPDPR